MAGYYKQCQAVYNQTMSTYHQKSRRNILLQAIPADYLYNDSNELQNQNPNDEDLQIQEIVKQEGHTIKTLQTKDKPKTKEKEEKEKKNILKPRQETETPKGKKRCREVNQEASDSQYQPDSVSGSEQEEREEDSYGPRDNIDGETLKSLNFLVKKFENQLSRPETKLKKTTEIAQLLQISVESVTRRVIDYFYKRKSSSSRSQDRMEHQTIYKKTQMFDDSIKRVLKVTPYACINDLREEIKTKLGLDLAKQTLIRRLKNLKYHYKKFVIQKEQRKDEQTMQIRKKFVKMFREISLNSYPVFFFAMAHMALDQCRGSMWMKSKENGELDHILYEKDVLHIGIVAAFDRIEFYHIYRGFYTHQSYVDFLKRWINKIEKNKVAPQKSHKKPTGDPRPTYLVIQSNLIHNPAASLQTNMTQFLLNEKVFPIPFPSHSVEMNPAEVLFNQIKYVTRGKLKKIGIEQLSECIEDVIEHNIDLQDIQFAFKKVEQVYQKY